MSFAFMPLYTGDYMRDTQHLSLLEHGAYLKLLMYCWDQKGPAPQDERRLMGICNARSKEEISAVYAILEEFFVLMDDGWYNKRIADEVRKAEAVSSRRAESGRAGGLARAAKVSRDVRESLANAKQVLDNCQAPACTPTPTPTTTPTTKKTKTHTTRHSPLVWLCDKGVQRQHAEDWLAIRKVKRLPATQTALEAIERQAELAGFTMQAVIRICCEKGWAGFKASWMETEGSPR